MDDPGSSDTITGYFVRFTASFAVCFSPSRSRVISPVRSSPSCFSVNLITPPGVSTSNVTVSFSTLPLRIGWRSPSPDLPRPSPFPRPASGPEELGRHRGRLESGCLSSYR